MTGPGGRSKLKTLWIFEHYAVPPSVSGFVRQYDHALHLKDRGWSTRIFASAFSHKGHRFERPVSPRKHNLDQEEEGIEFSWVYTTPYHLNDWRRYVNLGSYLLTSQLATFRRERPDVIIGASPHLLASLSGLISARRLKVPFVMEVQDLWPDTLIQLGLNNKLIIKALKLLERFLYRRADAVITLADGISDGVLERSAAETRVVMIPNGAIPVEPFCQEEVQRIREELEWTDRFVAIWAGQHGAMNTLATVVEAAKIIDARGDSNVLFLLVGDGPQKPELVEAARGLKSIRFLDPVPKATVDRMLQAADAGLMIYTDFKAMRGARPTKLPEYMMLGLPIISNLQGETARIIEEANVGVTVPPGMPSDLADAVMEAATNPEAFRRRGANGVAHARENYDRRLLSNRIADLIDDLVEDSNR